MFVQTYKATSPFNPYQIFGNVHDVSILFLYTTVEWDASSDCDDHNPDDDPYAAAVRIFNNFDLGTC
jgi:hypothetical protein